MFLVSNVWQQLKKRTTGMATLTNNNSGDFTGRMSAKTYNLVVGKKTLGDYLQAKIGNMEGIKPDNVDGDTHIRIDSPYANSEGVIKSMEKKTGFVKGLRIDLQKEQKHNNVKYATFQVQWGKGSDGKTGGAYAGALMRVNTTFNVSNLREALARSDGDQKYWRIDP